MSPRLPGFQTRTYEVELENQQQLRLNITLSVGGVDTNVEVTVAVDSLLATSSSSVGTVLSEDKVQSLPIVGQQHHETPRYAARHTHGRQRLWYVSRAITSSAARVGSWPGGNNAAQFKKETALTVFRQITLRLVHRVSAQTTYIRIKNLAAGLPNAKLLGTGSTDLLNRAADFGAAARLPDKRLWNSNLPGTVRVISGLVLPNVLMPMAM